MVLNVMLRNGRTGLCRRGVALTGADAPGIEVALVMVGPTTQIPDLETILCVRPSCYVDDAQDLLNAGWAVQVRVGPWPRGC